MQLQTGPSRQSLAGRKKGKNNRAKLYRDNKKFKTQLIKSEANKARKYKSRYFRLKNKAKKNSPMTKHY